MRTKHLLISGVFHLQRVVAELSIGVLQAVAPFQLNRVVVRVGQLALGRRGRQRPGVESGRRAERSRADAVDGSHAYGVVRVRPEAIEDKVCFVSGSVDCVVVSGVDAVVCDHLTVAEGTLPSQGESVGGGETKLKVD